MLNDQPPSVEPEPGSSNVSVPATQRERLQLQEQQLIAMKETGPKSAAWQRARLATLWRIQQRLRHIHNDAMDHADT